VLNDLGRKLVRRLRGDVDPRMLRARGLRLGRNVYIGRGTNLDGGLPWLISIGDDATISARVEVLVHDASTRRHIGYSIVAPVVIGRRVYVGAGSIILPGVTIGDGAIIGAGSVVTRDVAAGVVAVGNPARPIATTEEYLARHRRLLEERPVFPGPGWTAGRGATPDSQMRMVRELGNGHGYVE
jgi:maltose O-acetyltransferase